MCLAPGCVAREDEDKGERKKERGVQTIECVGVWIHAGKPPGTQGLCKCSEVNVLHCLYHVQEGLCGASRTGSLYFSALLPSPFSFCVVSGGEETTRVSIAKPVAWMGGFLSINTPSLFLSPYIYLSISISLYLSLLL